MEHTIYVCDLCIHVHFVFEYETLQVKILHSVGEQWKHVRSLSAKQIVPQRVANYAPGLCEIGDRFMRYIRHKRDSDGVVEDVNRALVKWAFQGSINV